MFPTVVLALSTLGCVKASRECLSSDSVLRSLRLGIPCRCHPLGCTTGVAAGSVGEYLNPRQSKLREPIGTLYGQRHGLSATAIYFILTVWNGEPAGFDAGSVNLPVPDMLKVSALYVSGWRGRGYRGPIFRSFGCQVMAHHSRYDAQYDPCIVHAQWGLSRRRIRPA